LVAVLVAVGFSVSTFVVYVPRRTWLQVQMPPCHVIELCAAKIERGGHPSGLDATDRWVVVLLLVIKSESSQRHP
jgi:hypothetical protein